VRPPEKNTLMLKRLKRWLGWDSDSGSLDFQNGEARRRHGVPGPKPPVVASNPARPPDASATKRRAKQPRSPLDALDNPRLTLDKPTDDGFDPYNTGAFNRSQSWEKIGRQRKR
jgi:hypothetical protein